MGERHRGGNPKRCAGRGGHRQLARSESVVSPDELRANAAWLNKLAGCDCPWPLQTEHDLREWALNVAIDDETLTGAEKRRVVDLIEGLDPPEQRRRRAARQQRAVAKAEAAIDRLLNGG